MYYEAEPVRGRGRDYFRAFCPLYRIAARHSTTTFQLARSLTRSLAHPPKLTSHLDPWDNFVYPRRTGRVTSFLYAVGRLAGAARFEKGIGGGAPRADENREA